MSFLLHWQNLPTTTLREGLLYGGQQRRDEIALNPLKYLFACCLIFDGSRNITDSKRTVALGPWKTKPAWKSLPGKCPIAVSSGFSLYKRGRVCKNPWSILDQATNVHHSSHLLNQVRLFSRSCFHLALCYIL